LVSRITGLLFFLSLTVFV